MNKPSQSAALLLSNFLVLAAFPAANALSIKGEVALPASAVAPVSFQAVLAAPSAALGDISAAPEAAALLPAAPAEGAAPVPDAAVVAAPEANTAVVGAQDGPVENAAALASGKTMFDRAGKAPGFSAAGITNVPLKTGDLPQGVKDVLVEAPKMPEPQRHPQFVPHSDHLSNRAGFEAPPFLIKADPKSDGEIEKAVRDFVDANPANYNGVTSAELKTVHVIRPNLPTPTITIVLEQQKDGLSVHNTRAEFTVKLIKDKLVAFPSKPILYGDLSVATKPSFSEGQMKELLQKRLRLPDTSDTGLELVGKKILNAKGRWHAVNLYFAKPFPVMIAFDIATGEIFAWDPRSAATSEVQGRAETNDFRKNHQAVLTPQALPLVTLKLADGRTVQVDENGRVPASVKIDKPVQYTARLVGRYARVKNAARRGKDLEITGTLLPGQDNVIMFNPQGSDATVFDQVNAYLHYTKLILWVKSNGLNDKRLEFQMAINVNIDDECNAYYTPGRPSLNFFAASSNCSDSGRPGVVFHEGGHGIDDALGGIRDGGLSEGYGDAMFFLFFKDPIVGRDFFLRGPRKFIRDGNNATPYSDNAEVHEQGEVAGGYVYTNLVDAMKEMGEAAGSAFTNALFFATLVAKPDNIPEFMARFMFNAMDKDGKIQHEAIFRKNAKRHGVDLPATPGLFSMLLGDIVLEPGDGSKEPQQATVGGASEQLRGRLEFSAGTFAREGAEAAVRRLCEERGLKYELTEKKGVFGSQFQLTAEGSKAAMEAFAAELKRLSGQSAGTSA